MAIILRSSKSIPLTFTEMDGNFSELNARATILEGAHIKNVNGVTTSSAQGNAITLVTDNITEGSTNQYFTNARSRSAISVTDSGGDGSLAYNSSTGVITYTGPSAAEVRAHISATSATGVTYAAGTGVIALASIPNSSITNSTITVTGDSGSTAIDLGDTLTINGGSGLDTAQSGNTLTIGITADGVNDTHIDFGTGANQVSTADIPEQTNLYYTDVRADARIAAASINDLSDVDTASSTPNANDVLTWNAVDGEWEPAVAPGASGGEANTGSSLGSGSAIFKSKFGVDLQFRSVIGTSPIVATENSNDVTLTFAPSASLDVNTQKIINVVDPTSAQDAATKAYADTMLPLAGGTMSGAIAMGTSKITGMGDPTADQDAATKAYVDSSVSSGSTLAIAGDSGTDNVTVGSDTLTFAGTANEVETAVTDNTVTIGLPAATSITTSLTVPTAIIDEVTISGNNISTNTTNANLVLLASGTGVVEVDSNIDMNSNKLVNVTDPTSAQDAATKAYVDSSVSSVATTNNIAGDSGTDTIILGSDTLTFSGTANEITTAVTDNTVTISLPDDVTIGSDLTVTGNLTVNGTTTTISTTNSIVEDSLIELNNGASSNSNDLGFIFERGSTGDNAVFAWDESEDKFVVGTTTATGADTGNLTIATGTLVANIEGNVTGSADTLTTARAIALSGDVVGTADFDGSAGISISTTIQANSVALGTDTTGNYVATITGGNGIASSGATSGEGIAHSLSVDLTDTTTFASDGTASRAVVLDGSGDFSAGTITANLTGNASGSSGSCTGNSATATLATNVTVTANNTADETVYITFVDGATGTQGIETDTNLSYNPSTNTLSTSIFDGEASSAVYADLAEIYAADAEYSPGTVVKVGGIAEITQADPDAQYLAGVISTAPAYLMNSAAEGEAVALVGRVPVRVVGAVNKGEAVFATHNGKASSNGAGPIVGIALESNSDLGEKLIECLLKV
jgi:hypothetical protein